MAPGGRIVAVGTAISIRNGQPISLDEVGAPAPKTSFHSLRHGFTDALRRAGATGEVIDGLLRLDAWEHARTVRLRTAGS